MSPRVPGARLAIFARAPVLGRVKSRLAVELGAEAALAAHVTLVVDTLQRLAEVEGVESELWVDDDRYPEARAWAHRWRLSLHRQAAGDLGERMSHALQYRPEVRGIVVGTDCPAIDAAYVRRAVTALDRHDVVVGPAADGGYGLVGARRPVPEIFRDIHWGSEAVLSETLEAAASAGLSVALLEQIEDIDTAADWRRYVAAQRFR